MQYENVFDKTFTFSDGTRLPPLEKKPETYLNKIILMYGQTGSGKTVMIEEIMKILSNHVPLVRVFSPTNASNNIYTNKVPNRLISTQVRLSDVESLYRRQEEVMEVYRIVNSIENLASVFALVANDKERHLIDNANYYATRRLKENERNPNEYQRRTDRTSITKEHEKYVVGVYKKVIRSNLSRLVANIEQLSKDQVIVVKFLDINPHILVIFDDCASVSKTWKNSEIFRKLFYESRHNFITTIFTFQGDTDITPDLRKSGHISIFATELSANTYFTKDSNGMGKDKQRKAMIQEAIRMIYGENNEETGVFRRLVFVRNSPHQLQWTQAQQYDDFQMCGQYIRAYCEHIPQSKNKKGRHTLVDTYRA